MTILTFDKVELTANNTRIFGPVSTTLDTKGITVVMGANGAGKSLFLALAHGLTQPSRGVVLWDGIPAIETRSSRGFVFQTTPVLRRSVYGNLALPLAARGIRGAEAKSRISAALIAARLDADPAKPAAALSGGERKRLDLARAIVASPSVILLDEPSANLDPATMAAFEASLLQIAERGTKIIISTHDIPQARRLGTDFLFFSGGQLCETSNGQDFFERTQSDEAIRYLKGEL